MSGLLLAGMALRWVHILAAIALMGGALFQRLALMPAAAELPDDAHEQLRSALRGRWSKVVMATAGLLLLSGLGSFGLLVANYTLDKSELPGKLYHMVFGIKFLLALAVFYIASLLAGRSELAQKVRQNARTWLTLNLVLATLVVCMGGFLRQAQRIPKSGATAVSLRASSVEAELRSAR